MGATRAEWSAQLQTATTRMSRSAVTGTGTAAATVASRLAAGVDNRSGLTAMAEALQALADVTDARQEICAIVARAMRAERVVLFEPAGDGIVSTASSIPGDTPQHYEWAHGSSAVRAFRTRQRILLTDLTHRYDDRSHEPALVEQLRALGITSVITEPVIRNGETIAALSIQFRTPYSRVRQRRSLLLEALAAGAASAIGRVDLLSQLAASAGTDPLTGLANRRTWQQRVGAAIAAADRDARHLTIAMIDVDHFKSFNDRYGHLAGDRLLTEVAAALTAAVRACDVVARWGGDEFAVLLSSTAAETGRITAQRIMDTFPAPATCSIGIADRRAGETDDEWLGRADRALLEAKASGRERTRAAGSTAGVNGVSGAPDRSSLQTGINPTRGRVPQK